MTPRSTIAKLLHWSTTPTMFLPMSCTSPLTVASTTVPLVFCTPSASASMNGIRCATAFFMTRADFTTCGRNILPEPNRSPTHVHAVHERAFDDVQRMLGGEARFFGVFDDVLIVARHQRMAQALASPAAARQARSSLRSRAAAVLVVDGDLEQALGGIGAAIEDHVLDALAQIVRNVVVNRRAGRRSRCRSPCRPGSRDTGTPSAWPGAPARCRGTRTTRCSRRRRCAHAGSACGFRAWPR